jgi:hypothetical protein
LISRRELVEYRESHHTLFSCIDQLTLPDISPGLRLGCVAVPTCKPLDSCLPGLRLAAELAIANACPLLVICSLAARAKDFPADLAAELGELLIVIDLDEVPKSWWPEFDSRTGGLADLERHNDVGMKRNLVLSIATVRGFSTALFIDDDIVACVPNAAGQEIATLDVANLDLALLAMAADGHVKAVGWSCEGGALNVLPGLVDDLTNIADHSVLGHARRLVGLPQKTFIGGGSLLVRIADDSPFFPNIYNEDWLYLLALAAAPDRVPGSAPALVRAGYVRQLNGHPFNAERARGQEAGDVLGEVLMNAVEDMGSFEALDYAGIWREAIAQRRRLIVHVQKLLLQPDSLDRDVRLVDVQVESPSQVIARVLDESLEVNGSLEPEAFVAYLKSFREDITIWREHLASLAGHQQPMIGTGDLAELVASGPLIHEPSR